MTPAGCLELRFLRKKNLINDKIREEEGKRLNAWKMILETENEEPGAKKQGHIWNDSVS